MKIIVLLSLAAFAVAELDFPFDNPEVAQAQELSGSSARIVNGEDTKIEDHPWQASFQFAGRHFCGAVVVSDRIAVTAAHCVYYSLPLELFSIRVGASVLSSTAGKSFGVAEAIQYPGWDITDSENGYPDDIAVLKFNETITGPGLAAPISIPEDSYRFTDERCIMTGWGMDETGYTTDILQEAGTTILSQRECKLAWGKKMISPRHICIFNGETSGCRGDSGGPVVCEDTLVGITSWGSGSCVPNIPGVYTRLSSYRKWVNGFIDSQ